MSANAMIAVRDAVAAMLRVDLGATVIASWLPDVQNPATTLATPRIDVIAIGAEFDAGSRAGATEIVTVEIGLRRYGADSATAEAHGQQFTSIVDALFAASKLGGTAFYLRELTIGDAIDPDVLRDNAVCLGVIQAKYAVAQLIGRN